MQDLLVDIGVSALLRTLKNKKTIDQWSRALAKVYVAIHKAAQLYPPLAAAIEQKEAEA